MDEDAYVDVPRTRLSGTKSESSTDTLVQEQPLEIRVGGVPLAVVMRTPGNDLELARGFLLTERVVTRPADIASIRHCTTVTEPEAEDNVILVTLGDDVAFDIAQHRRNFFASSSCGICGKATIDAALGHAEPLATDSTRLSAEVLYQLPDRLRAAQTVFDRTGGLHAAGLFDQHGAALVVREDIGRHNAVDKTIGWAATQGRFPAVGTVLVVSGRVSYEIIQKALSARIPIVAAVSAPSSLGIELARRAGMTVVAFLRGTTASVYAGEARIGPS